MMVSSGVENGKITTKTNNKARRRRVRKCLKREQQQNKVQQQSSAPTTTKGQRLGHEADSFLKIDTISNTNTMIPDKGKQKTPSDDATGAETAFGSSANTNQKQVEVVRFMSHKTKLKKEEKSSNNLLLAASSTAKTIGDSESDSNTVGQHTTKLSHLRHEVTLFGIKGFNKEGKQELMEKLAIKLGAKPAKNKYINYKDLINQRKSEKKQEVEKRQIDRALGLNVKKPAKQQRYRDINAVPIYGGTLGTYREGAQIINKKHITKFHRKNHR